MALSAIITGLIQPVINGIFSWKEGSDKMELSRQEFDLMKTKLEAEIQIKLAELERKPTQEFRDFMIKYEGTSAEQTPWVRNLRSSVRPLITYWAVIIITLLMSGLIDSNTLTSNMNAIPEQLWQIFLAVFGFWFGGRAMMQVAESWQKGNADKERETQRGQTESSANHLRAAEAKTEGERMRIQRELLQTQHNAGTPPPPQPTPTKTDTQTSYDRWMNQDW